MEVHRGEQYRLHDHNDIGVSEWLITSSAILVSAHQDCAQMTAVNETIAKTVVKKIFFVFYSIKRRTTLEVGGIRQSGQLRKTRSVVLKRTSKVLITPRECTLHRSRLNAKEESVRQPSTKFLLEMFVKRVCYFSCIIITRQVCKPVRIWRCWTFCALYMPCLY